MPSTALTVLQAEREGIKNFSVFCNHITIVPTIKAILDSPDLRLDGFLGPGHVSMVIGDAPYEFIARYYKKPMVIAGFEPLDILQSIWMLLRQIDEGRCEIENQYARVAPAGGNAVALRAVAQVYELREFFEWRGLGSIDHSGVKVRDAYAGFDAERKFAVPNARIADPKSCQCGEVLKGVIKPWQCKVFGTRLHAGDAARRADGVVRGRLRGILPVWRHKAGTRRSGGERRMNMVSFPPRRPRGKVHVPTVTLAHGGGGKAMKDLIDDVFVAAFDNPLLAPLDDQARIDLSGPRPIWRPAGLHDRLVRRRSAGVSRRRHRQACGLRHGERSRRRRRAAALSLLRRHHRGGRLDRFSAADRKVHGGDGAGGRRARSSPATPRSCNKGACDRMFITTTGIGVDRRRRRAWRASREAGRCGARQRAARRSRRGNSWRARRHGVAVADRERLRPAAGPYRKPARCGAGHAVHARSDARRRGDRAQ